MDEMQEIIADFVIEAEESLDKIEPLFVELETKGYNKDMLNDIFRSMHTLKGAAGFLSFQDIVDVSHRAESIMKKLRDNEVVLSRELIDVILKSVDTLRLLISHIKVKDGVKEDVSNLLKELDSALASAAPADAESGKGEVKAKVEDEDKVKVKVAQPQPQPQPSSPPQPKPSSSDEAVPNLRVDVPRIDKVMDLAGEIVLARNRLLNLAARLDASYSGNPNIDSLLETTAFLDRVTSDLQLAVMKIRMQPIQKVFGKFPRMVRDMSKAVGKDIDIEISGGDTEVDKTVIENIGDPLVHIIRNSIDHGIETPEERRLKDKPEKGKISLNAYQKGTQIVIEILDDGKGIDLDVVKRKAVSKGLISMEDSLKMSEEAAIDLIFLPGFSTKEVSTELSGRGVGMDVVKTNVSKLNGYVEAVTRSDEGTTFKISLPLTLAIIQAMMVRIGDEQYAIPQTMIEESIKVKASAIKDVAGQRVLNIRGNVLPFFGMSEVLGIKSNAANSSSDLDKYILVATVGDRRFCISVDDLVGQEEIVIKTISGIEADECGILGATITGDGRVVLILDLAVIVRS
ncbi:MAG: chemotaxis protein CheA [Nitrospirae bacterium]|nr:chemotaxis protein CheA [Nitrospirota bacterium]